ncbi:MAG: YidC/Oxa1 family membrane protein insertase [Treponema sp.]|nr:YidC/Oxa1 family membrane protein insertase [Treponema sp.]
MTGFLYSLVILPLESVIETLFYFAFDKFSIFSYGGAIVFVSLAVNLATLPVYDMADRLRDAALAKERALAAGVGHIRRTFRGDERFLMLREYYAQNHYSPLSPLLSSLSILMQIPFFIAAYRFLSNCPDLAGASCLFIRDLGQPDGLLSLVSCKVNLLPVLMTVTNILSGVVYSRQSPLREKVQVYVLALVFLVLLYASPSGLVLYWLLNNLFSLCKNLAQKHLKHPSLVIFVLLDMMAALASLYTFFIKTHTPLSKKLVVYAVSLVVFCLPLLLRHFRAFLAKREGELVRMEKPLFRPLFFLSAVLLALLAGFALPSSMIASSPEDFSFLEQSDSPLPYVVSSFVLMAGLFVFWPACFYFIASPSGRACISSVFSVTSLSALLNAFVFRSDYGIVNINGVLDSMEGLRGIRPLLLLAPVFAFAAIASLFVFLIKRGKLSLFRYPLLVLCLGLFSLGLLKCVRIQGRFAEYAAARSESARVPAVGGKTEEGVESVFTLTTTGKNVIVIFLDKAIGSFVPYILQDFPEIADSFSGFVYYSNTVSFANHTVKGTPALYGGYEYTPEEMNRRDCELLKDKHNEAMLAVPRLFSEAGWRVTDLDPPWMNYKSLDLSPFEDYPTIKAMNITGLMSGKYIREHRDLAFGDGAEGAAWNVRASIPRFCLLLLLYPPVRKVYYHAGDYYHRTRGNPEYNEFIDSYSNLYYMDDLTSFDSGENSYIVFANESAHDQVFMRMDEKEGFVPVNAVLEPSSALHLAYQWHEDDSYLDLQLYQMNCASLLRLGDWFGFLRENGAYDNSRIIIVSDHGAPVVRPFAPGFSDNRDYSSYAALLMVKDFASGGNLREDRSFMTNADVPLLSMDGLDLSAVNPFTGKTFRACKEGGVNIYTKSGDIDGFDLRNKKKFNLSADGSYHVHDDIYVESNWIPLSDWQSRSKELSK